MRSLQAIITEDNELGGYNHIPLASSVQRAAEAGFGVYKSPKDQIYIHYQGEVVGYMELVYAPKKPLGRCMDGWIVAGSVVVPGKRLGDVLYDIAAYWYAPLVSDRISVSRLARKVWLRLMNGTYKKDRLDDLENPITPAPEDDCLFQDYDELNWAVTRKTAPSGLEKMMDNHKQYMLSGGESRGWFDSALDLFSKHYSGE